MNVEDTIKFYRGELGHLNIDDSKKEKILNAFDDAVSSYQNKKIIKEIAEIVRWTRSEEAVIETAKTLKLYHNKKEAKEVAKAIARVASTESEEATIEVAKTLALYHNKKEVGKIARTIGEIARYTSSERSIKETINKLKDLKYIYNIDSRLFKNYMINISEKIPRKMKDSVSLKDINAISRAYTITLGFCKDEDEEFKNKIDGGFFHHLNKAIDQGKTIDDKIKIMNKWSDNVYTTFKDHPEDFMEFIR